MSVEQAGRNAAASDQNVTAAAAGPGLVETGPGVLSQTVSLGAIIAASTDEPVHILFVHGMRAGDRGGSATFRANLSSRLQDLLVATEPDKVTLTHRLDVGPSPGFTYMGDPIWPNDAAWSMGAFVDRYEYARKSAPPIIVDEVNWWPLALPLRCVALLKPEAYLAGADVADLRLCAALGQDDKPLKNDDIHYPFISKADFETLAKVKPPGGGAAAVNGLVKRALLDWGLSDAVIALGPMQTYLRAAIGQAFSYAADRDKRQGRPVKYVVVSESLGSFILFDAYAQQEPAVHEVLDATAYVYFFANQFGLLELGRLSHAPPAGPGAEAFAGETSGRSLHRALTAWGGRPHPEAMAADLPVRKQIIAFSDPSDALTFRVPPIDGVTVVNVYDRNGFAIPQVAADPVAAHTGHSNNPHVLDLMLRR